MSKKVTTSHSEFPKAYYKVAYALGINATLDNMYKIEAFHKGHESRTTREIEDFFESENVFVPDNLREDNLPEN